MNSTKQLQQFIFEQATNIVRLVRDASEREFIPGEMQSMMLRASLMDRMLCLYQFRTNVTFYSQLRAME